MPYRLLTFGSESQLRENQTPCAQIIWPRCSSPFLIHIFLSTDNIAYGYEKYFFAFVLQCIDPIASKAVVLNLGVIEYSSESIHRTFQWGRKRFKTQVRFVKPGGKQKK